MVYRTLSIVLLMTLAFETSATPDNVPVDGTISVVGVGEAVVEPDVAVVHFAVVTHDSSIAEALAKNNRQHESLLATLRTHGVADSDLHTVHLYVGQHPDSQQQRIRYEVHHSVQATLRDIGLVGTIVSQGLKHANRLQNMAFESSNSQRTEQLARLRAIDNAYENARQYAKRVGVSLGSILSISEEPEARFPDEPFPDSPSLMDPGMYGPDGPPLPVPIEAGTTTVRARMYVVFRIDSE